MKKLIIIITVIFTFGINANANDELLDVFEEYAQFDDDVCITKDVSVKTLINKSVKGKFIIECDKPFTIEIVKAPKKGRVEILNNSGEFLYTPFYDILGKDEFSYRVTDGNVLSNISKVNIVINFEKTNITKSEFIYADMVGRIGEEAAINLAIGDVMRGERVGGEYYFYPDEKITRIGAICYINSALGLDTKSVEEDNLNIFADFENVPYQLRKNAYISYNAGIIKGVRQNDKLYLYPDEYIKRAEFMSMIDRAIGAKTQNIKLKMPDKAEIPDYAKVSIKNLCAYNIIDNTKNTLLRPNSQITKEEMAQILYEFLKYKEKNATKALSFRIIEEVYGKILL